MPCSRYREALADRAAGGPVPHEVDAHLAACADCRSELEELRAALGVADAALRSLVAEEPGPDLRARILRAAAETEAPIAWAARGRLAATVFITGGLVAAALLVALWRSEGHRPTPSGAHVATSDARPTPNIPPLSDAPLSPGRPTAGGSAPRSTSAPVQQSHPAGRPQAPKPPREEPEVLVPPGEAEAVWRFAAALRDRVVDPGSLLTSTPEAPLVEPRPIDLVAIEVVALASSSPPSDEESLEEGDRR